MTFQNNSKGYELLDSGYGRKLERFGDVVLERPCSQAIWVPSLERRIWDSADATFDREDGNRWDGLQRLPRHWVIEECGIKFNLSVTDFGHLGLFPEQRAQWRWIGEQVKTERARSGKAPSVLNLFAYSGGSSMAAALAGGAVCHLDASRGMVQWASENAALNDVDSVRWIVDDAHKFMAREIKRGKVYDAIILDPPTFGRGEGGEMYKIERDLPETLQMCRRLLSENPLFMLMSAHTPGLSPQVGGNLVLQAMDGLGGSIETGEMLLTGSEDVLPLPSGTFARWQSGTAQNRG